MRELRYTFLSDGPADKALLPALTWLLREQGVKIAIQSSWADLRRLPIPPKTLSARMLRSIELYPCDLLFVHRDAETEPHQKRVNEIKTAMTYIAQKTLMPPVVCVVPVRMQEAWLLFNEPAVRRASGNPNGKIPLQIPRIDSLERIADPKSLLNELVREASGLSGRRRKNLPVSSYAQRVLEFVDDFSPLRKLTAFAALEYEVRQVVADHLMASFPQK